MSKKIKKFFKKLYAHVPTKLPTGMTEFKAWANDIIYTFDILDNDSIRYSMAAMIAHIDSTKNKVPKVFFAKSIFKAMSNQVSFAYMQEIKARQQEKANEPVQNEAV